MSRVTSRWVLGLDAVSLSSGAAIWRDGVVVATRTREGVMPQFASRPGDRLAGCLLGVLEDAGLAVGDLSGVAVTVGPGSFTGIRVGLALVHGLLQGTSIACVAIETCEAARAAGSVPRSGDASSNLASSAVVIRLRKADWFVQVSEDDEPLLLNGVESVRAVTGRRVISIGEPPPGVEPISLPEGLASAAANLGAARLGLEGWPQMETAERVHVLAPEYRRETYLAEARKP